LSFTHRPNKKTSCGMEVLIEAQRQRFQLQLLVCCEFLREAKIKIHMLFIILVWLQEMSFFASNG